MRDLPRSEMETLPDGDRDTIATLREHLTSARAMVDELRGKLAEVERERDDYDDDRCRWALGKVNAHKRADAWKRLARIERASRRAWIEVAQGSNTEIAQLERALSEKEAESAT